METEADICKRTGMLINMIWQLPQTTPLSYLVIFQAAPEPKGSHHGSWPASRNHASTFIIRSFIHYLPPGSNQSALL